jgi:hypothetical protein
MKLFLVFFLVACQLVLGVSLSYLQEDLRISKTLSQREEALRTQHEELHQQLKDLEAAEGIAAKELAGLEASYATSRAKFSAENLAKLDKEDKQLKASEFVDPATEEEMNLLETYRQKHEIDQEYTAFSLWITEQTPKISSFLEQFQRRESLRVAVKRQPAKTLWNPWTYLTKTTDEAELDGLKSLDSSFATFVEDFQETIRSTASEIQSQTSRLSGEIEEFRSDGTAKDGKSAVELLNYIQNSLQPLGGFLRTLMQASDKNLGVLEQKLLEKQQQRVTQSLAIQKEAQEESEQLKQQIDAKTAEGTENRRQHDQIATKIAEIFAERVRIRDQGAAALDAITVTRVLSKFFPEASEAEQFPYEFQPHAPYSSRKEPPVFFEEAGDASVPSE